MEVKSGNSQKNNIQIGLIFHYNVPNIIFYVCIKNSERLGTQNKN